MNHRPCFVRGIGVFAEGMPTMPTAIYEAAVRVQPLPETQVTVELIEPLVDLGWDGEHGNYYTPPGDPAPTPAATRTEQVSYIAFPIGLAYANHAPLPLRRLFAHIVNDRLPEPLIRAGNLPGFGRVMVTEQPALNRRNIHVTAYVPERRGNKIDMIEDYLTFRDIRLALRLDNRKVRRVVLAPDETPLVWEVENNYVHIKLAEFTSYAVIAVEYDVMSENRPLTGYEPHKDRGI
jgi:hypothetical protein